jgi:3-phytase
MRLIFLHGILISFLTIACYSPKQMIPIVVTDTVGGDSDDPAIWVNIQFPDSSLILGTDKDKENGGVYVFGLNGKINPAKTRLGFKRVNNIDVAYGFKMENKYIDIAVATERDRNAIRVFELPSMELVDAGGIRVFSDDSLCLPMGIALYKRPSNGQMFAIVGRKEGPSSGYLYQYRLYSENGTVKGELVRKFGAYSGKKEIESIAVDNELGYVYYSDEQVGVRKYYADPDSSDVELALFGKGEYLDDNEGISIYSTAKGKGYILVSDQAAGSFNVYPREGTTNNKHQHDLIKKIQFSVKNSDGSDVTSIALPGFHGGLFVAMSDDKTFHFYSWQQIELKLLRRN